VSFNVLIHILLPYYDIQLKDMSKDIIKEFMITYENLYSFHEDLGRRTGKDRLAKDQIHAGFIYFISKYERLSVDIINYFMRHDAFKKRFTEIKNIISPSETIDLEKILISNQPYNLLRIALFEKNISNLKPHLGRVLDNTSLDKYGTFLRHIEKDFIQRRNVLVHRKETIDDIFLKRIKSSLKDDMFKEYCHSKKINLNVEEELISRKYLLHTLKNIYDLLFYKIYHCSKLCKSNVFESFISKLLEIYLFEYDYLQNKPRSDSETKNLFSSDVKKLIFYFINTHDLNEIESKKLLPNICMFLQKCNEEDRLQKVLAEQQHIFKKTIFGEMAHHILSGRPEKSIEFFKKILDLDELNTHDVYDGYIFTYINGNDGFKNSFKDKFNVIFSLDHCKHIKRRQKNYVN